MRELGVEGAGIGVSLRGSFYFLFRGRYEDSGSV